MSAQTLHFSVYSKGLKMTPQFRSKGSNIVISVGCIETRFCGCFEKTKVLINHLAGPNKRKSSETKFPDNLSKLEKLSYFHIMAI